MRSYGWCPASRRLRPAGAARIVPTGSRRPGARTPLGSRQANEACGIGVARLVNGIVLVRNPAPVSPASNTRPDSTLTAGHHPVVFSKKVLLSGACADVSNLRYLKKSLPSTIIQDPNYEISRLDGRSTSPTHLV